MSVAAVEFRTFGPIPPQTPSEEKAARLAEIANAVRRRDARLINQAGQGHIGGDFSVIDIWVTLYFAVMRFDPANPGDPERDRLVLSKGHTAGALYTVFAALGLLQPDELDSFLAPESKLSGHPARNKVVGVEANTGPLGHGLPVAVGMALAGKLDGSARRTFTVVGDGELQEGSNWEAMMTAAHYGLRHLTVIADRNHLQQGATTEATSSLSSLRAKAEAFNFEVADVDGHNHAALLETLSAPAAREQPRFVIAHTVKGHPISFMSGQVGWHHKVPNAEQVATILAELGER
jgi:transketolase